VSNEDGIQIPSVLGTDVNRFCFDERRDGDIGEIEPQRIDGVIQMRPAIAKVAA
jgi:hypothetical protein